MGLTYSSLTEKRIKEFVGLFGEDIIAAITGTGLWFPAVVAQKNMESRTSKGDLSPLAVKYNNLGGIKNFGSLPGASGSVVLDTTEGGPGSRTTVKQPFAVFPSAKESIQVYVNILKDPTKKYTKMGVFTAPSPEEQILRTVRAGYSTNDPKEYLRLCQSGIDACLDLFPWGQMKEVPDEADERIDMGPYGYSAAQQRAITDGIINQTLGSILKKN